MYPGLSFRHSTRIAATLAIVAGGLALMSPAQADDGPRARLRDGNLIVTGTRADDHVSIGADARDYTVDFGSDNTTDATFPRDRVGLITVLAGRGNDDIRVTGLIEIPVALAGHQGNDHLVALTNGAVNVNSGAGQDVVETRDDGVGNQIVALGTGNDRFVTTLHSFSEIPRDFSVTGGAGADALEMNGSTLADFLILFPRSGHLVVSRNILERIDATSTEDVTFFGFGGGDGVNLGDQVLVRDLSGTGVVNVTPNFSASKDGTTPNTDPDLLAVDGTDQVDSITLSGSGSDVSITGISPTVTPVWLQPNDLVILDTKEGDDKVDTSGLEQGLFQLSVL